MYVEKDNIIEIGTPIKKWLLPFPSDGLFPRIISIYDENKQPVNWNYNLSIVDSYIELDFGFDNYKGFASYAWSETPEIGEENPKGIDTYRKISLNNITEIEIENSTYHSRGIKVFELKEETAERKIFKDITDTIELFFLENNVGGKYIRIVSNLPLNGFVELF